VFHSTEILRKPLITEKVAQSGGDNQVVAFEVLREANKTEIKKAVQAVFGVEVEAVRTLIVRGKVKRRGRNVGKTANWKKALVVLKPGQQIDLFGGAV
jgi:large subunit ribosomal protein L23